MNFLELITVGLPFCGFKIITGIFTHQIWLVVLGAVDLLINLVNLFSLIIVRRRIFDACFFSFLVRLVKKPDAEIKHKWQDIGNAADVLLSFTLVAFIIGSGLIREMPLNFLNAWNLCVVFNVFGAGSMRLIGSIRNLKVS